MSSFGAKRKARVIKVADEAGGDEAPSSGTSEDGHGPELSRPLFSSKPSRKAVRQSGLRKSFNPPATGGGEDDSDEGESTLVRPVASRSSSIRQKNRSSRPSKLSFGGETDGLDGGQAEEAGATSRKSTLGQRVLEINALKKGIANRGLPVRSALEDDDRPKYSKEYLQELQSSTPNTPQDVTSLPAEDGMEMELDASELEGALIVDSPMGSSKPNTSILTDAEIREKKERRARLAKEQDFLSVEDDDNSDVDRLGRKKKEDSRLKADEEEMGEGFDDFVEDGGLSLGKRATKERNKRERQQMAELINAAEGNTSDSSSDSDAERRIAYEAAQTRAGMDGLKKSTSKRDHGEEELLLQVPPKITPLPSLEECLSRLQTSLGSMEKELMEKTMEVEELRRERDEISKRESEVQALLDDAGRKYQEAMAQGKLGNGTTEPGAHTAAVAAATAAAAAGAPGAGLLGDRGLESLGATPQRMDDVPGT